MKNEFPQLLSTLRKNAKLTNIELAEQANVSRSLIPGLQSGKRCVGEYQARKLGMALGLVGRDLEGFIFSAINGCTEKVLEESKNYPAELLNLLAHQLHQAGINAEAVHGCKIDVDANESAVAILLNDGSTAYLETKLEMAA